MRDVRAMVWRARGSCHLLSFFLACPPHSVDWVKSLHLMAVRMMMVVMLNLGLPTQVRLGKNQWKKWGTFQSQTENQATTSKNKFILGKSSEGLWLKIRKWEWKQDGLNWGCQGKVDQEGKLQGAGKAVGSLRELLYSYLVRPITFF